MKFGFTKFPLNTIELEGENTGSFAIGNLARWPAAASDLGGNVKLEMELATYRCR